MRIHLMPRQYFIFNSANSTFRLLVIFVFLLCFLYVCPYASSASLIIDNGDAGTSSTGTWSLAPGAGCYGAAAAYATQQGATFTFRIGMTPGEYKVYAHWTVDQGSRSDNVPYEIQHRSGITTVNVNQKLNGGQWNHIGSWNFGNTAIITLRSLGSGFICADAIMLVPTGGDDGSILDNGDAGTSSTGTWSLAPGAGCYGATAAYTRQQGATFTFRIGMTPGEYNVYARWTVDQGSRSDNVPYEIQHRSGTTTVNVNQKLNGGQWNHIGSWNFGNTAIIMLRSLGSGFICADAIMLVPTGGDDGSILFYDSFDDGLGWLSRWNIENAPFDQAYWGVDGIGLLQQGYWPDNFSTSYDHETSSNQDESYHTGTYSVLIDPAISNLPAYRFSVEITPLSNAIAAQKEGNDVGVMFRYQDKENYYRVSMNARYGFTRFERVIDGIFSTVAVNAIGYVDDQPMTMTIEDDGDTVIVLIDGDPVFTTQEPAGASSFALYCQDRARFDNVLITEPTLAPMVAIQWPHAYSIALLPEDGGTLQADAVVLNKPIGGKVYFVLDDGPEIPATQWGNVYSTQFFGVAYGEHDVMAIVRDENGNEVAMDINSTVGTGGDYFVTVGDSITNGSGDLNPWNNDSADGRIVSIQGYQAELADSLTTATERPQIVFNEGIAGDRSSDLSERIDSIMERHPGANKVLLMIGTNDSVSVDPEDFKTTVTGIIDRLHGKQVWLALPLPINVETQIGHIRNIRLLEYAQKLREIAQAYPNDNIFLGPDFNKIFRDLGHPSIYYADGYHPTDAGYQVMAGKWHSWLIPSHWILPPSLQIQ